MKTCACHGEKMYWHKDSRRKAGGNWVCSVKHREQREPARLRANPQKVREQKREWHATRAHGITRTIRDWMYESQGRRCAGCGIREPDNELFIDHDHACCLMHHSCGACVRGLVCPRCNRTDVLSRVMATRFPGLVR